MNYFDPKAAAERYSKGRPDFHSNSIQHIRRFLQTEKKLSCALDIACGTGLSSKALLEIAATVYATDSSPEMLRNAHQAAKISYSLAPAEQQPFPDRHFDLITVCSGVHWFDIDRFLTEANRLLKSHAWLVLYDNFFISEMEEQPGFSNWFPEVYLKKFPSPPRNNQYEWSAENLQAKNFRPALEESFKNPGSFSKKELTLYFTTQSNITAAVESGKISYAETEAWLDEALSPFFPGEEIRQTIYFGNWIKYIQRND